jgi:translation elongation factor EF-1beta
MPPVSALLAASRHFDRDGSGFLESKEFRHILQGTGDAPLTDEQFDALTRQVERNEHGLVDFNKFMAWLAECEVDAGTVPLDDEPEFDLFGDNEEADDEVEARVAAAQAKIDARNVSKGKAPLVAKSALTIDVKPWEAETDMAALEEGVRAIGMPGLLWGKSKLVDLAFGIKKLQINAVVEDEVSTDELEELVCELEDYVQSMDIVSECATYCTVPWQSVS